jgi:hypothetical protein
MPARGNLFQGSAHWAIASLAIIFGLAVRRQVLEERAERPKGGGAFRESHGGDEWSGWTGRPVQDFKHPEWQALAMVPWAEKVLFRTAPQA